MKGVLLVNLGSPESPTPKDVKPYLDEFLMDKYVIDVPFLLRALLVRGIILQTRPKKSAAAYAKNMVGRRFTACGYFEECMKLNNLLMYLFHLPCVMEILPYLSGLQELHEA
jgi:protoheme ferro-lyase